MQSNTKLRDSQLESPNTKLSESQLGPSNPKSKTQNPKLFYWLPPLLWMAAISFFSTDNFSSANTGSVFYNIFHSILPNLTAEQFAPIHHLIRKTAHFTEYGIMGLLIYRAFRSGSIVKWRLRWAIYTILIVAGYALLDEYHQTFTATRTGSVYDSMIDSSGGLMAMILVWLKSGSWKKAKASEANL